MVRHPILFYLFVFQTHIFRGSSSPLRHHLSNRKFWNSVQEKHETKKNTSKCSFRKRTGSRPFVAHIFWENVHIVSSFLLVANSISAQLDYELMALKIFFQTNAVRKLRVRWPSHQQMTKSLHRLRCSCPSSVITEVYFGFRTE